MNRLLLLVLVMIGGVFIYATSQASDIEVNGELWSTASYYEESELEAGIYIAVAKEAGRLSFQAIADSFGRQGVDIFSRNGEAPIFSAREWYAQKNNFKIGKQTFVDQEGFEFDFIDLNPFGVRDLSKPFSSLDSDKILGNWGISARFMDDRLEAIVSLFESPILAVNSDNPWTRKLPLGMQYGDTLEEVDYSVGLRWLDSFGPEETSYYSVFAQRGSGNSPVDIGINSAGEIRPIVAEQTSIGVTGQFQFLEYFTTRIGVVGYFQEDYSDFTVGILENGRIWENIITDGDNLFLNVGYADVWETESGSGIPELDLRRIYEGGTALTTVEYAISDWVLKIKGAYNFKEKGLYGAPEISWFASDSIEVSLKYEIIDGRSDFGPNSIWAEYSEGDNITLKLIFTF